MDFLKLTASAFTASAREISWHWTLTKQPGGSFVNDHDVQLDTGDWRYKAFTDLHNWLERRAGNAGPALSEEDTVTAVGEWIAEYVLGRIAPELASRAPCVVVADLRAAEQLGSLPLELAWAGGKPLATQGVSLVIDLGASQVATAQPSSVLRMLGLFSVPDESRALNLRRERHELARLASELAGAGRAIELQTLQYGATRDNLTEKLEDGEGWDVVHLSGHGRAGVFVLEQEDGARDRISADEFAELLTPLRYRVKLITLSSCDSATLATSGQFEQLASPAADAMHQGAPGAADPGDTCAHDSAANDDRAPPLGPGLAADLMRKLGCAVVAMRYPVTEQFAASFAGELYRLLFAMGQPLARARAMAVAYTATGPVTVDRPALSAAVPVIYGASAVDLKVAAPHTDEPVKFTYKGTKLTGFPDQPPRFVGRVAPMSRGSQALAPRSGRTAIVVHGLGGTGTTAFALELAYTHRDSFQALAWYAAPGHDGVPTALVNLATLLDQKISGLEFSRTTWDENALAVFLPQLTQLLKTKRILLVIDKIDSLLSRNGEWRDQRWRSVINAMTSHSGLSRLIITTDRTIASLDNRVVLVEHLDPLPDTEMALLAREEPALRRLLDGDAPPLNTANAYGLARRLIKAARGYPQLIEAAGSAADDPARLGKLAFTAEEIWRQYDAGHDSEGARSSGYTAVLHAWTQQAPESGDGS